MKRNLLIIAAAALVLAGCAENDAIKRDVRESNKQSDGAIAFTSFTEKVTKAENSDAVYSWSFYDHQETFQVWARKSNQPNKEIFEGDTVFVSKEGDTYKYTYEPDRYWDKLADSYFFYAAAPAPVKNSAWEWTFNDGDIDTDPANINKGYFTIEDDKFALNGVNLQSVDNGGATTALKNTFKAATNNSKKDVDLLIADETPVARSFYNKANPEAVNLNFIHILSKLNITVSTSLDETGNNAHVVDLLGFEVYNIPSTGSFNESSKTFGQSKKQIRWTLDATPSTVDIPTGIEAYNTTTYAIDNSKKVSVPYTNKGKKYIVESLIIPQNIKYQRVALDGKAHDAVNENKPAPYASYEAYEAARHNDGVTSLTEVQFNALINSDTLVCYKYYLEHASVPGETNDSINEATFNSRVAEATKTIEGENRTPYTDYTEYTAAKDNPVLTEDQFNALIDNGAFVSWDNYTPIASETDHRINEIEFNSRIAKATATPETHIPAYTLPTEPYFTITYSIDGQVFSGTYNLAAAFKNYTNNEILEGQGALSEDEQKFAFYEGWQNTLNIIIHPSAIKFTADIAEWSDNANADYTIEKGNE